MPNTHTSVSVARIPDCDIHKHLKGIKGVPAKYDGRTKSGHWANMCQECYQEYGVGLGLGKGQELVLDDGSDTESDNDDVCCADWPGCGH
jgi:hypothetical protein